ncbi:MAG: hypothetical protein H3C30_00945, partial [Candidatus Hydrogenedentes bacterium]|nr:hypothetical protein [Candidatus Hydrogenedentota bacterium]
MNKATLVSTMWLALMVLFAMGAQAQPADTAPPQRGCANYADANQDGVCDNYTDADNDGK